MASKIQLAIAAHADDVRYDTKERGGLFMGRVMVDIKEGVSRCLLHTMGAYVYPTAKEAIAAAKVDVQRAIGTVANIVVEEEEVETPDPANAPDDKLEIGDTITVSDDDGGEISGQITKVGTKYVYFTDGDGEKHRVPLEDLQD